VLAIHAPTVGDSNDDVPCESGEARFDRPRRGWVSEKRKKMTMSKERNYEAVGRDEVGVEVWRMTVRAHGMHAAIKSVKIRLGGIEYGGGDRAVSVSIERKFNRAEREAAASRSAAGTD
jgi:hypothetical protein